MKKEKSIDIHRKYLRRIKIINNILSTTASFFLVMTVSMMVSVWMLTDMVADGYALPSFAVVVLTYSLLTQSLLIKAEKLYQEKIGLASSGAISIKELDEFREVIAKSFFDGLAYRTKLSKLKVGE